jgi:hypothetical protein
MIFLFFYASICENSGCNGRPLSAARLLVGSRPIPFDVLCENREWGDCTQHPPFRSGTAPLFKGDSEDNPRSAVTPLYEAAFSGCVRLSLAAARPADYDIPIKRNPMTFL